MGAPIGLSALVDGTFIEMMEADDAWTRAFRAAGLPAPRRQQIVRVDSSLAALELAAAGVGHALVLREFAARYLADGRLVDLLGVQRPARMSHYLLRPLDAQRQKPEALLFTQWLLAQAQASGLMQAAAEPPTSETMVPGGPASRT